ncbi:hypothetical protein GCM10023149_09810 [Mucilaginibacter gynuensis]|uniref:Peptidase S41-like protein n=1 Tax=Mucilaginibacter gynuensis TaxID=1302236 RepID=A0ABP8FYZ9_9SPHI
MKKNLRLAGIAVVVLLAAACSKKKDNPKPDDNTNEALNKIKDSVFFYAKEDYLWYDALPAYDDFKPRSFTGPTDLDALQSEVDAISQFKINPVTNLPYEYYEQNPGTSKYSFIDEGGVSGELGGAAGDFGFEPAFAVGGKFYIKYVYDNSPAASAGFKRGYEILLVNKKEINSFTNKALVNAFYNSSDITLKLSKPDGSIITPTISRGTYTINPVITHKTITAGSHKIGYMVFNSFTDLEKNAKPKIAAAFADFAKDGVTDLVIDLRYNGGGYISTSEYLANLIVPAAKNNTTMYTYYFNQNLQDGKFPLINKNVFNNQLTAGDFKPENNIVKFAKEGTEVIQKVVFLVTGNTASASELLVNNLLPHMDVKIVGETTYGKPVGFFAIDINKYELYIPEFETKNSLSKGGYYPGMTPGTTDYPGKSVDDDLTKEFGDPSEALLANAISYISDNKFLATTSKSGNLSVNSIKQVNAINSSFTNQHFRGMIFNKAK